MKTVDLPANHLRSISVSMCLIEKSIDELESLLTKKKKGFTYEVEHDIDENKSKHTLEIIGRVKHLIGKISAKYNLKKETTILSRVLNAKYTKMWEILSDTKSNRLKGYGRLPDNMANEIDEDISSILNLIEQL